MQYENIQRNVMLETFVVFTFTTKTCQDYESN